MQTLAVLIIAVVLSVILSVPAFLVARQQGLRYAWVAFVPLGGYVLTALRAAKVSGWWFLVAFLPGGGLLVGFWIAKQMPKAHGRTRWWTPAFVFLPVVSWYAYALSARSADEGLAEGLNVLSDPVWARPELRATV